VTTADTELEFNRPANGQRHNNDSGSRAKKSIYESNYRGTGKSLLGSTEKGTTEQLISMMKSDNMHLTREVHTMVSNWDETPSGP
jgi:outer membrane protein assembly factor BamA